MLYQSRISIFINKPYFKIDTNLTIVYTLVIMSDTTVLNVKIDRQLKQQAQAVAKALGLPVSTLVTASLREIVRNRSITISDPPRLRPEVEAELLEISAEAHAGKNLSPAFDDVDDAIKWLKAEVEKEDKK